MNVVQTRPQDPLGFQWELRELFSVIHHFQIEHNAPCLPFNILNGTTVIPRRNWEQQFWKSLGAKQGALWSFWKWWDAILKVEETPGNARSDFHTGTSSSQFLLAMNSFTWQYQHKPHSGTVLTGGIVGLIISNHGMVALKYHATSSCFILEQVFLENRNL